MTKIITYDIPMPRVRPRPTRTLRYVLAPDAETHGAIAETLAAYEAMTGMLAEIVGKDQVGADIVKLQRIAYEQIRHATSLPAQLVLLGIRDFASRRSSGEEVPGMPLDEKLYAIKGPTFLTLSTVRGRMSVHYDVAGYLDAWRGSAPARLVAVETGFEIRVGVTPTAFAAEESPMAYEGILSRVGRIVASFAHGALDRAEQGNQVRVVEQAIREIDREAGEARTALGRHTAERHRLESRRSEIQEEIAALNDKIQTAVDRNRDDLAKAGIERQMDLEAQIAALDVALADVNERIEEAQQAVHAVIAARREADARLAELQRSVAPESVAAAPSPRGPASPVENALRSLEAISRATGVPVFGGNPQASQMNELERLHRDRSVEKRLAELKGQKHGS